MSAVGDARKRLAEQASIVVHHDPAVVQLIEQARAEGAAEVVARVEALDPTWHRGMYGCPDDMFSRRDLRAALRGPR